jgi:lipoprotein-releasing system permease protein
MIVGVLNIAASLWMIVIEKTQEHAILMSLGLKRKNIINIILIQGAFIGLSGSVSAALFSFLFLKLQILFRFITLPSDIYFMNYLPASISFLPFFLYTTIAFILTVIFSYIPAKYASKNNIINSLSYE